MDYKKCMLCPRKCAVDRTKGQMGFCKSLDTVNAARAALHYWEEPCISGSEGSGAVFFSGCSLKCVFCQNGEISRGESGKSISGERLVEILYSLKDKGANNINLVTATHWLPTVIPAIERAKKEGIGIPFVYNTSGYENEESIKALDGLIDIYLPDMKYHSSYLSARYSGAKDYFEVASRALGEMVRQKGVPRFDCRSMMKEGVIVRHLLLPECSYDSKQVLKYLYETYGDKIYISIMRQYTPPKDIGIKYPELDRVITDKEYARMLDFADSLGIKQGFWQESECVSDSFIPKFDNTGI